jgi:cytochrome c-type biogenesis protein CcmF
MIAELGLAALWLAAALALLQLVAPALALGKGGPALSGVVVRWRSCRAVLALIAFAALSCCSRTDMSVLLVAMNSIRPSRGSTSSRAPGAITKARCCCGSR